MLLQRRSFPAATTVIYQTKRRLQLAVLRARLILTFASRQRKLELLAQRGAAPMSVLFYHRVADHHPNDWTISCSEFERHVDYCRKHFDIISLEEVQRRVREKHSYRPSVAFTFDDGYADNCLTALPLLSQHNIPCVYFVTVKHLLQQSPFPHDLQAGVCLPVNSIAQIRQAADSGVEIGLHTYSHFDFSAQVDQETIQREIYDAKNELEQWIDKPVRYFAVPYGMPCHLRPQIIEAVHRAGMLGFCSAFGGYNLPGRDAFHIRRIHGDPEFTRLLNWLSFDERKVSREPLIEYDISELTDIESDEVCHAI